MNTPQERAQAALAKCRAAEARVQRSFVEAALCVHFTRREREILRFLIDGFSTKQIASALEISLSTADTHIRHLCDKAGVAGPVQAALFGIQQPKALRRGALYRRGLHVVSASCPCAHCQARREVA